MQMKVEEHKYAILFGLMKKNVIMVRNSVAKKPKQIKKAFGFKKQTLTLQDLFRFHQSREGYFLLSIVHILHNNLKIV